MKNDKSTFAHNLIFLRKTKRLSQELLAKQISMLSENEYSKNIIASYETDRTIPKIDFISKIEFFFDIKGKYDIINDNLSEDLDLDHILNNNLSRNINLNYTNKSLNNNMESVFLKCEYKDSSYENSSSEIKYLGKNNFKISNSNFESIILNNNISELETKIDSYKKQLEIKNSLITQMREYTELLKKIISEHINETELQE